MTDATDGEYEASNVGVNWPPIEPAYEQLQAENARLDAEVELLRKRVDELEAWRARACYLLGHAYPRLKGKHSNEAVALVNELANEKWRDAVEGQR